MKLFFGNNTNYINTHTLDAQYGYVPIDDLLNLGKLNDLNDLTIASPQNDQFIVYNSVGNVWQNKDPADALIALGITAATAELNLLDFSEQQGINTKFLRGDGIWSDVTAAGITGLTSDGVDTLSLNADYKFSFEGTTSNEFETVLKAEDPTQDNIITLPDYSGEISLSPIQTNFHSTYADTYTFTKNNEHVVFQSSHTNTPTSDPMYVTLPDLYSLFEHNIVNIHLPRRGARFSFSRTKPGDVYVAPASDDIKIDIVGDSEYTLNVGVTNYLTTGEVYKVISGGNTNQTNWNTYAGLASGDPDLSVGDFFTSAVTGYIVGDGMVYKAIKIPAESFKSGCINITGTQALASATSYYFIENPNLSNIDTVLTGTTNAALLNSTTLSTSTLKLTANSKTITVKGPNTLGSDYTLNLPEVVPVVNSVLRHVSNGNFVWEEIKNEDDMGGDDPSATAMVTQSSIKTYLKNNLPPSTVTQTSEYTLSGDNMSVTLTDAAFNNETVIIFSGTTPRDVTKAFAIFMPEGTNVSRVGQSVNLTFEIDDTYTFPSNQFGNGFQGAKICKIYPNLNDPTFLQLGNKNNYSPYSGMFNFTSTNDPQGVFIDRSHNGIFNANPFASLPHNTCQLVTKQTQHNYSNLTSPISIGDPELDLVSLPTHTPNGNYQDVTWKWGWVDMIPTNPATSMIYNFKLKRKTKSTGLAKISEANPYRVNRFRDTGNTNNQTGGALNGTLTLTEVHYWDKI